jgi:hypothetical protein
MKKIGLFGDSFGYQKNGQPFDSWVDLLANHFRITNHSECGVGEYKILKQLKKSNLDSFDFLIITHTSATRTFVPYNPLHSKSAYHKNCDILYADIADRTDDFSLACQLYFKYIFDLDYAVDIHNMVCQEIDKLTYDKKVLHITHFDYTGLYKFTDLINFYNLWLDNRGMVNHYNQTGNQLVYQTILKKLL